MNFHLSSKRILYPPEGDNHRKPKVGKVQKTTYHELPTRVDTFTIQVLCLRIREHSGRECGDIVKSNVMGSLL